MPHRFLEGHGIGLVELDIQPAYPLIVWSAQELERQRRTDAGLVDCHGEARNDCSFQRKDRQLSPASAVRRQTLPAAGAQSRPVPQMTRTTDLAGRRCWIITDGKTGMDVQVRGVADALGLAYDIKHVSPEGLWRALAPFAPVRPGERFAAPGSPFAPPFPDFALATGRLSIPYLRALRRRAGPRTYCVVLQDPRTGAGIADLIWVPAHDRRRGGNVITTLTAPHSFTQARLAALRQAPPAALDALPRPRVGVILGGPNAVYSFSPKAISRLSAGLGVLAASAGSFLVTPSRRTPAAMLAAVNAATQTYPRLLWNGDGRNPYAEFLANADILVVTADSVNMTGEACATGRPVYVFAPDGGSAKFSRFHDALRRYGATRPLPETPGRIEDWAYPPLDSAAEIAAEIVTRWQRRQAMVPGGWPAPPAKS